MPLPDLSMGPLKIDVDRVSACCFVSCTEGCTSVGPQAYAMCCDVKQCFVDLFVCSLLLAFYLMLHIGSLSIWNLRASLLSCQIFLL